MLVQEQVVVLGVYKVRIQELLGGRKNLTYKVIDVASEKPLILRVVEKPTMEKFLEYCTEDVRNALEKFFNENEILKEKYEEYTDEAGYEIYSTTVQGQVTLEAKILKEYKHPVLSNLISFTQDEKAYYILLDYNNGKTLKQIMDKKERVAEEKILNWIKQIAEALNYLHTNEGEKILYNNMNPSDILIDESGCVKFLDLQKVKIYDIEKGKTEEWQDMLKLDSAAPYCPVEGYNDPRAELYSLGVLLYHFVTGETVSDAKDRETNDTIRLLRELKPEYSTKLQKIIAMCLEMKPEKRIKSADELIKLFSVSDFSELKIESKGELINTFDIGKIKNNFEKTVDIKFKKPESELDPLKVKGFICIWYKKPGTELEMEVPKVELKYVNENNMFADAKMIITTREFDSGIYEGILKIDTNWGYSEVPIRLEIPESLKLSQDLLSKEVSKTGSGSSPVPIWIGGIVIGFMVLIFLIQKLFSIGSYTQDLKKWNNDNWPTLIMSIPSYILPSLKIEDTDKWETYAEVPGINIKNEKEGLTISGINENDDYVRTGLITRFFSPAGNMAVIASMKMLKENDPNNAGLMLISSKGNAVAIEYSGNLPSKFRMICFNGTAWENKDSEVIKDNNKNIYNLKIEYDKVNGMATGYLNNKRVGEFLIEMDDIGIMLYSTAEKKDDEMNVTFKGFKVISKTLIPKMFPYIQMTTVQLAIRQKPDEHSRRIIYTANNEKVLVNEEREEWCRVKTMTNGTYEGWVKKEYLRDVIPKEIKLDIK